MPQLPKDVWDQIIYKLTWNNIPALVSLKLTDVRLNDIVKVYTNDFNVEWERGLTEPQKYNYILWFIDIMSRSDTKLFNQAIIRVLSLLLRNATPAFCITYANDMTRLIKDDPYTEREFHRVLVEELEPPWRCGGRCGSVDCKHNPEEDEKYYGICQQWHTFKWKAEEAYDKLIENAIWLDKVEESSGVITCRKCRDKFRQEKEFWAFRVLEVHTRSKLIVYGEQEFFICTNCVHDNPNYIADDQTFEIRDVIRNQKKIYSIRSASKIKFENGKRINLINLNPSREHIFTGGESTLNRATGRRVKLHLGRLASDGKSREPYFLRSGKRVYLTGHRRGLQIETSVR